MKEQTPSAEAALFSAQLQEGAGTFSPRSFTHKSTLKSGEGRAAKLHRQRLQSETQNAAGTAECFPRSHIGFDTLLLLATTAAISDGCS